MRVDDAADTKAGAPHYEATADDVAWARQVAAYRAREVPHLADEYESAALLGLHEAALAYDPGRGVKFRSFALRRVLGAIKDACRAWGPAGYRRHWRAAHPGEEPPPVVSLDAPRGAGTSGRAVAIRDEVPGDDLPVGWELEYEDEVRGLARRLPAAQQAAFVAFHTRADGATMRGAGDVVGVCESRVSQILARSGSYLRGRFAGAPGLFMTGRRPGPVIEARGHGVMTTDDQVNGSSPGPPGPGRLTRAGKPRKVPGAPCPDCGAVVAKNGRCYGCAPGGSPPPVNGEWVKRSGFPRAAATARPGTPADGPGREAVAPAPAVDPPAPIITDAPGPVGQPDDLLGRELAAVRAVRVALAGLPAESVSFVLSAAARHLPAAGGDTGQGGVR